MSETSDSTNETNTTDAVSENRSFSWTRVVGLVAGLIIVGGGATAVYWYVSGIKPPMYPAKGIVLLDGEPMAGGAIISFHESGLPGGLAGTDEEGRFNMTTDGAPGVYAGEHKLTFNLSGGGLPPVSLLPAKYSSPTSTPVTIVVNEDSAQQELRLELTGRISPGVSAQPDTSDTDANPAEGGDE